MIHIEELKNIITQDISLLSGTNHSEFVELRESVGRVLAADIVSPLNIPTSSVSAMDGYGLFVDEDQCDEGTSLQCIGESIAGIAFFGKLVTGECVRIMTGAVVPDSVNTVIMQEHVERNDDTITLTHPVKKGVNIRHCGEEVTQGLKVFELGKVICESDIPLLASLGNITVNVKKKLKIGLFSTGNELRELGEPLEEGQLYDSNRPTIQSLLSNHPVEITDYGIIVDDLTTIISTLEIAAAENDIVVTSGGVSVGDYDFLRDAVTEIGNIVHYKVAMKPGKPFVYGRIGNARYFGLPGNPLSTAISAKIFLVPAIYQALTGTVPDELTIKAMLTNNIQRRVGRAEFQRGIAERDENDNWIVTTASSQDSHRVYQLSLANVLIFIPADTAELSVGDTVTMYPLRGKFI